MSEQQSHSPGFDPSQLATTALQERFGVHELQDRALTAGQAVSEQMASLAPLHEVPLADGSSTTLLATIRAGYGGAEWQVWGHRYGNGQLDASQLRITNLGYDPHGPDAGRFTPLYAGNTVTLGRNDESVVVSDNSVSRRHMQVSLGPQGEVTFTDPGSANGSHLLTRTDGYVQHAPQQPSAASVESIDDTMPGIHHGEIMRQRESWNGAESDPAFIELCQPYRAGLEQNRQNYEALKATLQQKIEANKGNYEAYEAAREELDALKEQYETAQQQLRGQFEEDVKPYLRERLEQQKGDSGAYYANGAAHFDAKKRQVVTRDGKTITHYVPNHVVGRDGFYFESSPTPRMGQISAFMRFDGWVGGNSRKTNHKTGVETSSFEHIVDLAAAMTAGSFDATHEPVQIARDTQAEAMLSSELQGRLPLYKVRAGMHRIAAWRLLEGVDAPVSAEIVGR